MGFGLLAVILLVIDPAEKNVGAHELWIPKYCGIERIQGAFHVPSPLLNAAHQEMGLCIVRSDSEQFGKSRDSIGVFARDKRAFCFVVKGLDLGCMGVR